MSKVIMSKNLNDYDLSIINPETRKYTDLDFDYQGEKSIIEMSQSNTDILNIGEKII